MAAIGFGIAAWLTASIAVGVLLSFVAPGLDRLKRMNDYE